ncbi:autotransporter assembly complex family protein [Paraferrimonas sp. SM1919]|uniref:autotransporter assembly complex protein TamA n=1 Tax=Paraferrimonas sp. SM1919 TaxID=2662263 RepID=UPI0013D75E49|nr:autotransporter assembly complex family protein [Paraferrimonas sp. SM1919]
MKFRLALTVLLLLHAFAGFTVENKTAAPNLEFTIAGADQTLANNIKAHLGALPTNVNQRNNFIFSVEKKMPEAFQSLGYYQGEFKTELDQSNELWKLHIIISTGPRTTIEWVKISIEGEAESDPDFDKLLDKVNIKPGMGLNHGSYETLKSKIQSLGLTKGYFNGKFIEQQLRVNRLTQQAQILLHYDSGKRARIGRVSFFGSSLDEQLLNNLVPFKFDSPYSSRAVSKLNQALVKTNYFSSIKVLPLIDEQNQGRIPIKVDLQDKPDHSLELGLGASTDDGPRFTTTWRTPSINEQGHRQQTTLELSQRPKVQSIYTIPLTHANDDLLNFYASYTNNKYGLIQTLNDNGEFDGNTRRQSDLFKIGSSRQYQLDNEWLFSYYIEAAKENYTEDNINYSPFYAYPGLTFSKVYRGDASLDPASGYRQHYRVDYADPFWGSKTRLIRLDVSGKWINTFNRRHRVVLKGEAGINLVNDQEVNQVIPSLRFYAGGDNSIRGFERNELGPSIGRIDPSDGTVYREIIGGRYKLVASAEYQYYLNSEWRVAGFVDGGNAFNSHEFDPIVSVGSGIHWISPIGPIKLDLGVGVVGVSERSQRPWRVHLVIGSEL